MSPTPRSDLLSPDCRDEFKHRACSGDAWDDIEDLPAACECPCHEPEEWWGWAEDVFADHLSDSNVHATTSQQAALEAVAIDPTGRLLLRFAGSRWQEVATGPARTDPERGAGMKYPVWTHDVRGPQGTIVYFGTEEECVEWAALTGAERDVEYTVTPIAEGVSS